MDWLCFSPSLVDILSLVDYKDIANCARVNRRIHDVILRNRKTLPRPWADLTITFCDDEKGTNEVLVELKIDEKKNKFAVTARLLEFIDCASSWIMDQYKREYRIPKWKEFVVRNMYRDKGKVQAAFITKGLEEGLAQILSLIFERYHLDSIGLKAHYSAPPLDLCEMVANLQIEALSECDELILDTWSKKTASPDILMEIIEIFDCPVLTMLTAQEGIDRLLPSISDWDREFYFELNGPLRRNSLPHIVDVVRKWQSGAIDIDFLEIALQPAPDGMFLLIVGGISRDDISNAVESMKFREELLKPDGSGMEVIRILFKRSHDDVTLTLTYSPRYHRLRLRECCHKQPQII